MDCSTDNSAWMQNSGPRMRNKKITQITIAGAHYANAYGITKKSTLCKGEILPQSLTSNARILEQLNTSNGASEQSNIFMSTLNTQDSNVGDQLGSGVRYLELQICQQDGSYFTSNLYLTDELSKIAKQITDFLKANPQEIIILDLDNNLYTEYGLMNSQDIALFHAFINQIFDSRLVSKDNFNNTLAELAAAHEQIIILSSNPILSAYPDIISRKDAAFTASPTYPTIKKITLLESFLGSDKAKNQTKLNILPVYSDITYDVLSTQMYQNDQDQQIVLNYLRQHINNEPGIIVGTKNNISDINEIIINQAIDPEYEQESNTIKSGMESSTTVSKTESGTTVTESATIMHALTPATASIAATPTASSAPTHGGNARITLTGFGTAPIITPSSTTVIPSAQMSPPPTNNLLLK